jgi:hypothetical protein
VIRPSAARAPGASGAPIIDEAGLLTGLVAAYPQARRTVAGVVPPARYATVPARQIGAFLAAAGVTTPAVAVATAGRLAGSVVGLTCQP